MPKKRCDGQLAIKVAKKWKKKSSQFIWLKKIERDVSLGRLNEFNTKYEKKRYKDRLTEIQNLKKRRDEKEAEKARREEESLMLQRQRIRAEADRFEEKECNLFWISVTLNLGFELEEPCMIFNGLMVREIEELRGEIELRLECLYRISDDNHYIHHVKFWEALMVVCDWELGERRRQKEAGYGGLHPSIESDVRNFLQGIQSYDELIALEARIESDMRSGKRCSNFSPPLFDGDDTDFERAIDPAVESSEDDFEAKVNKLKAGDLEEGESVLGPSAEVNLGSPSYWWHDIYRPRKPKYFIKYHTGYVWNQYNRTHYGPENPPPKFVQGYKFNIFYPHLVDQTKTPQCFIQKDGDSTDTCILRFHAGPPYEDIAFELPIKTGSIPLKKVTNAILMVEFCMCISTLRGFIIEGEDGFCFLHTCTVDSDQIQIDNLKVIEIMNHYKLVIHSIESKRLLG
ncbi:Cactin [Bienertia sinuspersici]